MWWQCQCWGELHELTKCQALPAHRWALTTPSPGISTLCALISQHCWLCPLHVTQIPQDEHPQAPHQIQWHSNVLWGASAVLGVLAASVTMNRDKLLSPSWHLGTPSREIVSSMPGPSLSGDAPGTPDPAQWVTPGSQPPQKLVLGGHDCPALFSCATRPIPGRTGEWRAGMSQGSSHTPRACCLPPAEVMGQTDGMHSWANNQAEQEQDLRIPPSYLPWTLPTHPKPTP